ncbi:hypothetical protein AVEN_137532-1 [Araneus ventricosus]|uniref:Protein YIF1 n=1 Tax=Araneus ventricosus TaxID=182803 RepID=A0A4Y2JRK4_ARAVE|nr:hypothetical protein AVEN_137532-1 [Araneus ventricosus]
MPVIKQRDANEDCAKTLASTENKLAEDANTSFIEEESVKDRSPPKQGVNMVAALIACISFKSLGYCVALGYCTLSLGFFLIRTLRVLILPKTTADHFSSSSRHTSYLLLGISIIQPILMYVLTKHLVSPPPTLDVKI